MQLVSTYFTAGAAWRGCYQQASPQVALHVTKRQNGAKESNLPCVMVGNPRTNVSREALSDAGSLRFFMRWSKGLDTSATAGVV
jgi:hypothetical protein